MLLDEDTVLYTLCFELIFVWILLILTVPTENVQHENLYANTF